MTILEQKLMLGDVPALIAFAEQAPVAARQGTILLLHGLYASKEGNRKELASLARRGFLAVGLDAPAHGERADPGLRKRLDGEDTEMEFARLLQEATGEIPGVIDELERRGLYQGKIGITGISMGGYVCFSATAREARIDVAAPILGSPVIPGNGTDSPHRRPESFFPRALLIQNAGRDRAVPPRAAREFAQNLLEYYRNQPSRLRYVEYPDSEHFMREEDWYRLWNRTLEWFVEFLPAGSDR